MYPKSHRVTGTFLWEVDGMQVFLSAGRNELVFRTEDLHIDGYGRELTVNDTECEEVGSAHPAEREYVYDVAGLFAVTRYSHTQTTLEFRREPDGEPIFGCYVTFPSDDRGVLSVSCRGSLSLLKNRLK